MASVSFCPVSTSPSRSGTTTPTLLGEYLRLRAVANPLLISLASEGTPNDGAGEGVSFGVRRGDDFGDWTRGETKKKDMAIKKSHY